MISDAYLHPSRVVRVQSAIKSDGIFHMRGQRSSNVEHRHLDGLVLPRDAQVGAAHIRVDEQRKVGRVHVPSEVHAVHLGQVVVPLLRELQ